MNEIIENDENESSFIEPFEEIRECEESLQAVKVFLRLKPVLNNCEPCFKKLNNNEIAAEPPINSRRVTTAQCQKRNFSFSHIFDVDASQSDIFEKVVHEPITQFVNGTSALIFNYGATGSGKTYTLQGNDEEIGMLPRAIKVLFDNITALNDELDLIPSDYAPYKKTNNEERNMQLKRKSELFKFAQRIDKENFMMEQHFESCGDQIISSLKLNCEENDNVKIALFVSCVEIYNENIYDLLTTNTNSIRSKLEIKTDKFGNPFLKGVTYVPVFNAKEAYCILKLSRRNQQVASTRLNLNSSRSHFIFSIRALRTIVKTSPTEQADGNIVDHCEHLRSTHVQVVDFNFCDLAGCERTDKAETTGLRFHESKMINNSLTTLKRCIDLLRMSQKHPEANVVVPYRDSKLTRLLQKFFTGSGRAYMIANISLDENMFGESIGTLQFSSLAQKIVNEVKDIRMDVLVEENENESVPIKRSRFAPTSRFTMLETDAGGAMKLMRKCGTVTDQEKIIRNLQNQLAEREIYYRELLQEKIRDMEECHRQEICDIREEMQAESKNRIIKFSESAYKEAEMQVETRERKIRDDLEYRIRVLESRICDYECEVADQNDVIENLTKQRDNLQARQRTLKHRCSISAQQFSTDPQVALKNVQTLVDEKFQIVSNVIGSSLLVQDKLAIRVEQSEIKLKEVVENSMKKIANLTTELSTMKMALAEREKEVEAMTLAKLSSEETIKELLERIDGYKLEISQMKCVGTSLKSVSVPNQKHSYIANASVTDLQELPDIFNQISRKSFKKPSTSTECEPVVVSDSTSKRTGHRLISANDDFLAMDCDKKETENFSDDSDFIIKKPARKPTRKTTRRAVNNETTCMSDSDSATQSNTNDQTLKSRLRSRAQH